MVQTKYYWKMMMLIRSVFFCILLLPIFLFYLHCFNLELAFAIDINSQFENKIIEILNEHQKYTIPFVEEGISSWIMVQTYRNMPIKKRIKLFKELLISPTFLNNQSKLEKTLSKIIDFNKKNFLIFFEESTHKVNLTIPFKYKKIKKASIEFHFVRKEFEQNIYKWFLTKVIFPNDIVLESKKYFIGLNEVEIAKKFSPFIDRIKKASNEEFFLIFSRIICVDSSVKILSDLLSKKILTISEESYNVTITYQILNIQYGISHNEIEGFKYIIFKLYKNLPNKQCGWLLEDEGEMFEYYINYNPNSSAGFYIKKLLNNQPLN